MPDSKDKNHIRAVKRTIDILMAFTELKAEADIGVSELARHLQMAKSVVHRSLTTLIETGFVVQDTTNGRYKLGSQAINLGLAALGQTDLARLALPIMEQLREKTNETITLSLLVGHHRVYTSQLESSQTIRMTVEIGKKWPLYAGSSGKSILSGLMSYEFEQYLNDIELKSLTDRTITTKEKLKREIEGIRERGYAVSAGERDPWAASAASCIFSSGNRPVGAVSICGPLPRFTPERVFEYGSLVKEAAVEISAKLGSKQIENA